VTYLLPTVNDGDDASVPTAVCSPASGATFAIGTTTVTCSVSDADDMNGPLTNSFTVTVLGAPTQLTNLLAVVAGVGPGSSLAAKVRLAQTDLAFADTADACSTLTSFTSQVQAQSGKSIPTALARQLIDDARRIQAIIGC
jgi:hypothetical protein